MLLPATLSWENLEFHKIGSGTLTTSQSEIRADNLQPRFARKPAGKILQCPYAVHNRDLRIWIMTAGKSAPGARVKGRVTNRRVFRLARQPLSALSATLPQIRS